MYSSYERHTRACLGVFRILDELLRCRIAVDAPKVGPLGIDGQEPAQYRARPHNILQSRRFLVRQVPSGVRLLLEAINRPRPRHDTVNDTHQHGTRKEEGRQANTRHGADQLHLQALKLAILAGTRKVIPAKNEQGRRTRDPGVAEKEGKMLQVARADAIVHCVDPSRREVSK